MTHPDLDKRWFSVQEVASVLGLTAQEARFLIDSGTIRSVTVAGRLKVIPSWVDEFVAGVVSQQEGKQ